MRQCLAALLGAIVLVAPAQAATKQGTKPNQKQPGAGDSETTEVPDRHAYKLGDFRIKNFRPVEREKVTLEFTVYVEAKSGLHERFELVSKSREHRIRNQVITSARLVPPREFDDPTLHALHRRIYLRLRRAVPELPIDKVFISDFSYILE